MQEELEYNKLHDEYENVLKLLDAISDRQRAEILYEIVKAKEIRVSEIKTKSKLSRPAISHHVKILLNDGVIGYKRIGTKNYYYPIIDRNKIDNIIRFFNHVKDLKDE